MKAKLLWILLILCTATCVPKGAIKIEEGAAKVEKGALVVSPTIVTTAKAEIKAEAKIDATLLDLSKKVKINADKVDKIVNNTIDKRTFDIWINRMLVGGLLVVCVLLIVPYFLGRQVRTSWNTGVLKKVRSKVKKLKRKKNAHKSNNLSKFNSSRRQSRRNVSRGNKS